jgi:hypothetical protein
VPCPSGGRGGLIGLPYHGPMAEQRRSAGFPDTAAGPFRRLERGSGVAVVEGQGKGQCRRVRASEDEAPEASGIPAPGRRVPDGRGAAAAFPPPQRGHALSASAPTPRRRRNPVAATRGRGRLGRIRGRGIRVSGLRETPAIRPPRRRSRPMPRSAEQSAPSWRKRPPGSGHFQPPQRGPAAGET